MVQVMKAVEAIKKEKRNQQQNFIYRGIDDVYGELHRHFAEAGIYCRPEAVTREQFERASKSGGVIYSVIVRMRYHLTADDGSSITLEIVGEGMDSADKATNKAMAIAHKYALLQAFMIPTHDMDDPDGHSPEPTEPSEAAATGTPAPARTPARAPAAAKPKNNAPAISALTLFTGIFILSSEEVKGTSAKGPWVMWAFTLSNGVVAKTFKEDLAQAALALVDDQGRNAVDVEVGPGRKPGTVELLSVFPADDVPT